MDNKKKSKIVLIIGSIILVVLALTTTTYSLFYNEQVAANPEDYSTGLLSIEAKSKSDIISLNKAVPKTDEDGANTDPYIFTVKNNGNLDYNFDIKLSFETSSNNIDTQYIKLKVDNGSVVRLSSLPGTNNEKIIKSNITLSAKESMDITLRVWLDLNTPNTEIGKTFTSKIVTNGQAMYTTSNYDAYDALPDGYQRVEYIESSGNEYINTNYIPTNTSGVLATLESKDITNDKVFFGQRPSTDGRFWVGNTNNQFYYGWNTLEYLSNTIISNTKYIIGLNYLNSRRKSFEEENFGSTLNTLTTTTYPIIIFGSYNRGTIGLLSKIKLYNFNISEGDTIVMKFIPCYRVVDNEIGLYDIVGETFYENLGTGDFIAGPEI